MAVKLNRRAYEHAKALTGEGRFEFDERDAWSEHQPSAREESEYIRLHGFAEYGKWYLGVDDERPENTKGHYEFPSVEVAGVAEVGISSSRQGSMIDALTGINFRVGLIQQSPKVGDPYCERLLTYANADHFTCG